MPRKRLIRSCQYPYHIVNRSIDKQFYPLSLTALWDECCDLLRILSFSYGLKIHAFVLMSNHYHLLASAPEENLDDSIAYFQCNLSRWIHEKTNSQKFRFAGPYRWSLITKPTYFLRVYRYVYQNPIRAHLSIYAEDYPMSSLSGRAGKIKNFPPIFLNELFGGILPESLQDELSFINERVEEKENEKLRRGLIRAEFRPPLRIKDRRSRQSTNPNAPTMD